MAHAPGDTATLSGPAAAVLALLMATPLWCNAGEPDRTPGFLVVGVLAHDRGPSSDKHERGVDPTVELQFRPPARKLWQTIGAPRPHAGLTPNFNGDTSIVYGGATYAFDVRRNLFAELGFGLALHNGPLRAEDPIACKEDSDCGFGSRVLLRYAVELGVRLRRERALMLFFDHVSHKELFASENEGIDHIGLRYRLRY